MTRYAWIDSQKAEGFPVRAAPSACYDWKARHINGPTWAEAAEADLVAKIRQIWEGSDGTYGEPRMTAELARQGWKENHKRVERLMRAHGMVGVHQRRPPRTTIPAATPVPVPDLVGRDFAPKEPDVAWAGDITYIGTGEGWLYLASVLDLGSRRLLGYSMAERMPTELVLSALEMAIGCVRGGPVAGVIFHSDRGSQYLSGEYRQACVDAGIRQSAGRTGVCWDMTAPARTRHR